MLSSKLKSLAAGSLIAFAGLQSAVARDVTITIPRRSELTPVQRLNREGVEAVKKHRYEKAETLFYKAYLYDPADPFTLNNIGYIAELQGQMDRAQKFYELASEQGSNANIDMSNVKNLEGRPMMTALAYLQDVPMKVNRMNVDAMRLLSQDRAFEAIALLRQARTLDPQNPFTLNNLGVAEEAVGDFEGALRDYTEVANSHDSQPVVVALDRSWRGRTISEMAEVNARRVNQMQAAHPGETQAAMLSVRGVFAANQNDWRAARQDFLRAYSLDPASAFSLNNRGYVAEMDGDLETAQFFYEKAQKASDAGAVVGLATKPISKGERLFAVATDSNYKVDGELDKYSQQRHQQTGPVELTPRGSGAAGASMAAPEQNTPAVSPSPAPQPLH